MWYNKNTKVYQIGDLNQHMAYAFANDISLYICVYTHIWKIIL